MDKFKTLLKKSIDTYRNYGAKSLLKKTIDYIKKYKYVEKTGRIDKQFADVLFVNGCFLPHPTRYRVSHQMEQLFAGGVTSCHIFYEDISLNLINNFRLFIFFRCPITDAIKQFISEANKHKKTVIFDIDDLIIDTKYTNMIKYLQTFSIEDKTSYDDGVNRMKETMYMCDSVTTTTEKLAFELRKYVKEVYVNRNTASNRMVELSKQAVFDRDVLPYKDIKTGLSLKEKITIYNAKKKAPKHSKVKIGYFSGSITHNDDLHMVKPVLIRILRENSNVELHLIGELDIPSELRLMQDRITIRSFVDWQKLPDLIADVDINIVPLEESIFNEAKSENKWIEASLVKVVTVASNIGALKQMIVDKETGFLCSNNEEWYIILNELVKNAEYRKQIAENAYNYVYKNCITTYTAYNYTSYIKSRMKRNIAFIIPSLQISGGILVALKHCLFLKEAGFDVLLLNEGFEKERIIRFEGKELLCVTANEFNMLGSFDKCVATLWSTVDFLLKYPWIKERYYLVQNFETDFYEDGLDFKLIANSTYCFKDNVKYVTISEWCKKWLDTDYNVQAKYGPNGIDTAKFFYRNRDFSNEKIRILIEGNSDAYYKNVDESFKIVDKLDKNKFEIWYMSYQGEPKSFYYFDKFLHKISYDKVPDIYRNCHILIKSSILESFSYPPLEMMSTGGISIVAPNDGNKEYLVDKHNCLFYELGNIDMAVDLIYQVCKDQILRTKLIRNGLETAKERDWNNIKQDILNLYL
jgi:O-antigen biosynthesis protein